MDDKEIGEKIEELTNRQRSVLFELCEQRQDQPGGDGVAVYVKVGADMAKVLHDKHLVWVLGSTQAAARGDVYLYWRKHISNTSTGKSTSPIS